MSRVERLHSVKRLASRGAAQPVWEGAALSKKEHALVLVGLGLGTLLEWYDFQLYSGLSNVISDEFFPKGNAVAQALSFWGVFALAFVTRPIGAIVFGHVGDRIGRKVSLLISIVAMALPTVLIGCLPSYQMIGIAAPIILAALRVIQGLAIGGEYGTAVVYAAELSPPGWEGRHGTYIVAWCQAGLLLGEIMVMLMVGVCSKDQLALWGWRIPFLLVVFSASLALLLRLNMPEPLELIAKARLALEESTTSDDKIKITADDKARDPEAVQVAAAAAKIKGRVPISMLLRYHFLALALHTLVVCFASASVYTVSTWLPNHLRERGIPNITTQVMFLTALVAKLLAVLLTGWAADKGMPICWAGVVNALGGVALNFVCCVVTNTYQVGASLAGPWVMQVVLLGWTGMSLALVPTIGINIYPPEVRASGYNLGYSLSSGLVGGLSPLAVTAIRATGNPTAVYYGAALWTLASGAVSAVAYGLVLWYYPVCNRAGAQPLVAVQRRPQGTGELAELRAFSVQRSGALASSCRLDVEGVVKVGSKGSAGGQLRVNADAAE